MMKKHATLICFVAAIAFLFLAFQHDAAAKNNFARKAEPSVSEESSSQPESTPCQNPPPCCHSSESPTSKNSPSSATRRPVSRFLAFGCRLNYRLTDWILSDKCDAGPARDCP